MGYAISWLAVRGKSPEAVAQELGLTTTGETAQYGESLFTGRTLTSGWFLLVINQCEHDFVKQEFLASLSNNCEVLACSIEEHVMFCSSELWMNGERIWRIEHDAQKSIDHINSFGALPDGYLAIEREFSEEQKKAGGEKADVDFFLKSHCKRPRALLVSSTTNRVLKTKILRFSMAQSVHHPQVKNQFKAKGRGGSFGNIAQQHHRRGR